LQPKLFWFQIQLKLFQEWQICDALLCRFNCMSDTLKVKDNKDLVRLKDSKAILNVNSKELDKYKQDREEKIKLKELFDDNEKMKNDIEEIKSLLRQLIGQK
jgi:hypothetical protein